MQHRVPTCLSSTIRPIQRVVSLTAWFKLPNQGITQFEVLSQATALPVRSPDGRVLFLTSQHVVLPWRFPNYYQAEWLKFVNPEQTAYTIECREGNRITSQYLLTNDSVINHPTRDVAALALNHIDENVFLKTPIYGELVTLSESLLQSDLPVVVAGYEMNDLPFQFTDDQFVKPEFRCGVEPHNGLREQQPINLEDCQFSEIRGTQHFLRTPQVLAEGMCGGGVFGIETNGTDSSVCHGIIEGIVPLDTQAAPELAGYAAYIDSVSLSQWLMEI